MSSDHAEGLFDKFGGRSAFGPSGSVQRPAATVLGLASSSDRDRQRVVDLRGGWPAWLVCRFIGRCGRQAAAFRVVAERAKRRQRSSSAQTESIGDRIHNATAAQSGPLFRAKFRKSVAF